MHTNTIIWHNVTMYCESFPQLFSRLLPCLHAQLHDLTCTLPARLCLSRLDASLLIVSHHARSTTDRCLHHVATSMLLTNCPESKPSDLAFTNSRPPASPMLTHEVRVIIPELASRTNNCQNVPYACHCTRNSRVRTHASSDVARLPRCTQPSTSALLTSHGLVDSLGPSAHLSHARVEPSHDLSET